MQGKHTEYCEINIIESIARHQHHQNRLKSSWTRGHSHRLYILDNFSSKFTVGHSKYFVIAGVQVVDSGLSWLFAGKL